MAKKRIRFSIICCCISRGSRSQTASGGAGRVQQEDGARRGVLQHVDLVHELELVAGDEARPVHEVGGADGRGLERRCETVMAPDFFES